MYGMYINYLTGTQDKIPLIANNFISLSGTYTGTVYGIYSYYGYYNNFFHNSINIACGGTSARGMYLYGPTSGNYGYIDLRNNIIINNATGYALYVPSSSVTGNYLRNSDYNDLYSKGTNLAYYGSSNITTLTDWRKQSYKDINSISTAAPFKSATDLHLTSYTGFSLSNPLTEVPYDIDGNLRSSKKPIIGADERPPIANDAGITAIVNPKMVSCDGSLAIQVQLTNFGTNKLTSVRINTKVNTTNLAAYFFSGSLDYLEDTVIYIGNYTFKAGTSYKVFATTLTPNGVTDLYADNNSDSIQNIKLVSYPVISTVVEDEICKGTNKICSKKE